MAIKPKTTKTHILNMVVGCTEIPFFTVRCIQSFDLSRKHITLIVACNCAQFIMSFRIVCVAFVCSAGVKIYLRNLY